MDLIIAIYFTHLAREHLTRSEGFAVVKRSTHEHQVHQLT